MFSLSQPIRLAVQDKLAALRRLDKRNPMQKPFYIFGTGCQGRCILNAALEAGYRPSAFLDDHPQASDLLGVPIFVAAGFPFEPGFRFVVGIGDCHRRREKFDLLLSKGGEPMTIIHPDSSVSRFSRIGAGTVVFAYALLDPCVRVDENCIVNAGAMIGHDAIVERDTHVSGGARVGAGCHIGEASFLGIGAIINNGVTVGRSAFLAMGALVSHDVPPHFKAVSPHRKEAVLTPIAG
jgi:sugar O-acyltransferase (sialic acid O-acetyltransferase NeuD family)